MRPLLVRADFCRGVSDSDMEIGDLVVYRGILCFLRGLDPMGVSKRRAELEDAVTGEHVVAPLEDLQPDPLAGEPTPDW